MFGMGWAELMIVGIVALIVVGPKDLPIMFRKLGEMVGKARGMAREFTSAMNKAADESGFKETTHSFESIKESVKAAQSPTEMFSDYLPGSETEKLAKDRKAEAQAVKDKAAERAAAKADAAKAETAKAAPDAPAEKPKSPKAPATPKETADAAKD
ncbi:MAG: Sec-independent protein translocase protein TatB, partial [Planktomarina sp.]